MCLRPANTWQAPLNEDCLDFTTHVRGTHRRQIDLVWCIDGYDCAAKEEPELAITDTDHIALFWRLWATAPFPGIVEAKPRNNWGWQPSPEDRVAAVELIDKLSWGCAVSEIQDTLRTMAAFPDTRVSERREALP